jgi:hypothetical protein
LLNRVESQRLAGVVLGQLAAPRFMGVPEAAVTLAQHIASSKPETAWGLAQELLQQLDNTSAIRDLAEVLVQTT